MITLILPSQVQDTIKAALHKSGRHEVGGVLMAEHVGPDRFEVKELTVHRRGSVFNFVRAIEEAIGRLRRPPRKRRGVQTVGLDSRCHLCGHVSRSRSHCCDCRPSRCPNRSLSPNHCPSRNRSRSRWPNRRRNWIMRSTSCPFHCRRKRTTLRRGR